VYAGFVVSGINSPWPRAVCLLRFLTSCSGRCHRANGFIKVGFLDLYIWSMYPNLLGAVVTPFSSGSSNSTREFLNDSKDASSE
jgi:hypothetical protein